jgi:hypothetical protein
MKLVQWSHVLVVSAAAVVAIAVETVVVVQVVSVVAVVVIAVEIVAEAAGSPTLNFKFRKACESGPFLCLKDQI